MMWSIIMNAKAFIGWMIDHLCAWWYRKPPLVQGTVQPGFEQVVKLFRDNYKSGLEPSAGGSAFSVYYKGSKVIDLWSGFADTAVRQLWQEDTMTLLFSTTKGFSALCMVMLIDRGLLNYEQTVAFYWPEFAQNGKENITVRMLLNHEAGLAATTRPLSQKLLKDPVALGDVLAESPPLWTPGSGHGYHAFTYGLLCSQLLSRVDPQGRTLGQFFKEEVAVPFDVDVYIGLPLILNHRVARLTGVLDNPRFMISGLNSVKWDLQSWWVAWGFITGQSIINLVIRKSTDLIKFHKLIRPEARACENPSSGGIATARGLAKIYGILANGGQTPEGQRLLSENMVERIFSGDQIPSTDKVIGLDIEFSSGFMMSNFKGNRQFGHPGAGGQQALSDPNHNVGIAYLSSHFSLFGWGNDPRFLTLQEMTMKCVKELESQA